MTNTSHIDSDVLSDLRVHDPLPNAITLPSLYGPNAFLLGNVKIVNPHWSEFGCIYNITASFVQSEEQTALMESLIQLVETGSLSGLTKAIVPGSALDLNPNALVSVALEIGATLDMQQSGDEKSVVVYSGPIVKVVLSDGFIDWNAEPDTKTHETVLAIRDALSARQASMLDTIGKSLTAIRTLTDQNAMLASSSVNNDVMLDADAADDTLSAASTVHQQMTTAKNALAERLRKVTQASKHFKTIAVGELILEDLAAELTDVLGNNAASEVLQQVVGAVGLITAFVPEATADEITSEEINEAAVEPDAE